MIKRAVVVVLLCASVAGWISCGTTSSHYVYASLPASNQILGYREDPNSGVLTPISGSPFGAGNGAQSIVVHPSGKFMYAANPGNNEDDVSLFTIATTGVLTEVTPRTPVGTAPTKLLMDAAGGFLYVENSLSNNVSVFSIDSGSGALTPVTGSPFPLGIIPQDMVLAPSGKFLYVSGVGEVVAGYSVNAGVLTLAMGPVTTQTSVNFLTVDPTGSFLYAANTLDNSISIFSIASGTLTEVSGSPLADPSGPTSMLFNPSGKYLYVANQGSGNIAAYTISSSGFPTALSTATFGATTPAVLAADPNGKYLLVGNQSAGIQLFGVDSNTGFITSFSTYAAGGNATSIVVIPQP